MVDDISSSVSQKARHNFAYSLLQEKYFVIGLTLLLLLGFLAVVAPWLSVHHPDDVDLFAIESPPSHDHWLGTDEIGRDVLARLLYGGRVSVLVGLAAVLVQLVIGVTIGALAGFCGRFVDGALMRLTETVMCFPFYAIAITLAAIFGASIWNVILIIGILNWTGLARLVRAELLSLREREFVLAAKAMGVGGFKIITHHLLRNAYPPILVYATLAVANGILAEAALSFLGLGVRQPQPSWGNMLAAAQSMRVLTYQWWLWIPPGLAIAIMVLSINFVGEGLARVFNPRGRTPIADLSPVKHSKGKSS